MNSHFLEQQARERIGQMMREASSSRLAREGQSPPAHGRFGLTLGAGRMGVLMQTVVKSVHVVSHGVWRRQTNRTR